MAYKYSRGAFVASGSVTLEEGLTVTGSSTLGALTTTTISGTTAQYTILSASNLGGAAVSGLSAQYIPSWDAGLGRFENSFISRTGFGKTIISGALGLDVTGNVAVTSGFVSSSNGLSAGGESTLNNLTVNGNLTVLGTTISASVQNLIIEDKQIVLADGAANAAAAAGAGFFVSGANVEWTYKQNGEGSAASSGDIFVASGSSGLKAIQAKTFYGDLIGSTVYSTVGIGDANQNPLATGVSYANATFAATRTWTLPNLPTTGSSVKVKGPSNLSPTIQLIVAAPAGYDIDGETTAVLESPYAAVECVFVGGPSGLQWKIF